MLWHACGGDVGSRVLTWTVTETGGRYARPAADAGGAGAVGSPTSATERSSVCSDLSLSCWRAPLVSAGFVGSKTMLRLNALHGPVGAGRVAARAVLRRAGKPAMAETRLTNMAPACPVD